MSRERATPKFLRDVEHDGSVIKRLEEIRREEQRSTAQAIVTQPESPYAGYYRCDEYGIDWIPGDDRHRVPMRPKWLTKAEIEALVLVHGWGDAPTPVHDI